MNKVEIFKRYFWNLLNKGEYRKAAKFKDFIKKYFLRKGQKTEYVYCIYPGIITIDQITDKMLDNIE